jgi:Na+/proline symporter
MAALHPLDAVILIVYLAALASVGVYFSRRQRSLDEYFLARQSMSWLPVGLSLMAALDSAIDYLMQPSATIRYGLILLTGTISWLFLYPWVAHVTLPFYRRLNYFTAYEYLEARFDVRVRTLAAGIFIMWRLGWMATALYVPCLAIEVATSGGLPVTTTVVVLGAVVTVYTAIGGVKAVIWNDVMQFCVRFGGLATVVAIAIQSVPGGIAEIWRIADAAGKTALLAPIATAPKCKRFSNSRSTSLPSWPH